MTYSIFSLLEEAKEATSYLRVLSSGNTLFDRLAEITGLSVTAIRKVN